MHPAWRRCVSSIYQGYYCGSAPCQVGASTPSLWPTYFWTGPWLDSDLSVPAPPLDTGPKPAPQADAHEIEAEAAVGRRVELQETPRRPANPPSFRGRHALEGRGEVVLGHGAHLDDDDQGPAADDEVQLALRTAEISLDEPVAPPAKEAQRRPLPLSSDLGPSAPPYHVAVRSPGPAWRRWLSAAPTAGRCRLREGIVSGHVRVHFCGETPRKLRRWMGQGPCVRRASRWALVP